MLTDDARYKIFKALESNPDMSQRQLAAELGISLGRVNYCLQALIEKGQVKVKNFSQSANKKRYLYVLTPAGIESKARLTKRFLKRKIAEYEALKAEIAEIQKDLERHVP
ncbi:MarR family EPS-associated transcriptional regulator [Pseudohongiella sp. SYSU M77423]|uniref:MarR family EPS-associated transcriptional regulator n=1 Tax=Pseudohongiella sp. SYSU M77423 TaxID=3042312 RepID=UPI0024800B0A|nr:MarR family EPS-associated transcriptional regulator [Pseudohongiella sp. SYSU M77423]MDH7944943.1 MarR family EPS-associated transcriptional regulator [Pseudohongiella sp. SYSU M77423]